MKPDNLNQSHDLPHNDRPTPNNPRISVLAWFDNINLVAVLVVSDQILKVMDCFVCCKTFVFEIQTNEQIRYL